jgi:3-methyl-2-oxobutanoate hydroxymethyltransferase
MDDMLHHCRAVKRGSQTSLLVGDMPFGSYQVSPEQALTNATRFIQDGHMEVHFVVVVVGVTRVKAVKLEGGKHMAKTIGKIVTAGIPVFGHIGLTPQSQMAMGSYRVQGKTAEKVLQKYVRVLTDAKARALVEDALAVQEAGCCAVVLEAIPEPVAKEITAILTIPTIGIGAGAHCGGQVLVQQDMLGLLDAFTPR